MEVRSLVHKLLYSSIESTERTINPTLGETRKTMDCERTVELAQES
jgi:hypothetical protein